MYLRPQRFPTFCSGSPSSSSKPFLRKKNRNPSHNQLFPQERARDANMPQPSSQPSNMASPSYDYNYLIPVVPTPRTSLKTVSSSSSSLSLPSNGSAVAVSKRFPQCSCGKTGSSLLYSQSDYEALYFKAIDYDCECRACSAASLAPYLDDVCMTSGLPCGPQNFSASCCTCPPCMLFCEHAYLGLRCEITGFYPTTLINLQYGRQELLRARLSRANRQVLDAADEAIFVFCGGHRGHRRTYMAVRGFLTRHVLRLNF